MAKYVLVECESCKKTIRLPFFKDQRAVRQIAERLGWWWGTMSHFCPRCKENAVGQ